MSQPTLPRLLPLLQLLLLHLFIIPSAISAQPLTQHKSTPSSLALKREDESPISTNGLCGSHNNNNQKTTCLHSPFGDSCSKWGFCGSFYEKEYSGRGCQVDFGVCNPEFATATNDDVAESSTTLSTSSSSFSFSRSTTPGIIIIPITTTFVSVVVSTSGSGSFTPIQTLTGMVGFCGVAGSNCKM